MSQPVCSAYVDTLTSVWFRVAQVTAGLAAYTYIPMTLAFLPVWIAYGLWTGTCATGSWVVAHECGHGAFSDNKFIQDLVGYVLHTVRFLASPPPRV